MISLTSYGAAGEVTGSKHVLKIDDEEFLIDCGMWQGPQEDEQKNRSFEFKKAKNLKAVLLTHAHLDHCGLLPVLIKSGYEGNIYCTSATRDLASIVLMDSAKINSSYKNPIYSDADVMDCVNHFRGHAYGKTKILSDKLKYTAYDAGHILGSSMFDVECIQKRNLLDKLFGKKKNSIHILFTGDLGRENNPITNDPSTSFPVPDYIVLESTYGDRLHETLEYSIQEMVDIINYTIEREGKVIIPSFAIERAQEIIYYLKVLMMKKAIPKIPVYVDSPMATSATGVFSIHPECFNHIIKDRFISQGKNPFSVSTLHIIKDNQESVRVAKSKKPAIIIAASGMCEKGRVINHLKYGLSNYNNTILTVGYMSPNTIGYQLTHGAPYVVLDNEEVLVKANIASISAFSAHADYKEMLVWLSKIDTSKLKNIFLVHGNESSLKNFQRLLRENNYKSTILEKEKSIILQN